MHIKLKIEISELHYKLLCGRDHDLVWPLCNICVTNDHRYVPLVVSTSQSFPHSWFITRFVTRVKQWVSIVMASTFTNMIPWFRSFLVSSSPLSRTAWYDPQALEYRINLEIYTPYTGAAGMLQHMKRYSRACGSYQAVLDRGLLLTRKLLNQGIILVKVEAITCFGWKLWPIWFYSYQPLTVNFEV
jgi:hypothetical protein